jgi:uncharacterized protein YneF (UPF0154 family)
MFNTIIMLLAVVAVMLLGITGQYVVDTEVNKKKRDHPMITT